MSKITLAKLFRKYEKGARGEILERSSLLPSIERKVWNCGKCGKEYRVAPGQLINCKCR